MQRIFKFIVVLFTGLFCARLSQAQSLYSTQPIPIRTALYNRLMQRPVDAASLSHPVILNQTIPSDYYTRHFGFFCDKELKVEKATGIPLRLRLGTLESCNRLEGKN